MKKVIENILEQEDRVSSRLRPEAFDGLRLPEDQRAAAAWLMKEGCPSRSILVGEPWGIYTRNVPILHQLLNQPVLIVNIHTHKTEKHPEDSFAREYGVTPKQMARLVDMGLVIPHLYEARTPLDYDVPHLAPLLLRNPDRWIVNSIRLGGLRNHLKKSIPKNLEDFSDYTERILKVIDESEESQLTSLFGWQTSKDIRKKIISTSWEYLHEFAANIPELTDYLFDIRERAKDGALRFRDLEDIFGAKVWFTTPITAAFGGTHIMSPAELTALYQSDYLSMHQVDWRAERASIHPDARLEFLFSELSPLFRNIENETVVVPSPHNQRGMDNFISFLTDQRQLLVKAESHLSNIYSIGVEKGYSMQQTCDWIRTLQEVKANVKKFQNVGEQTGVAVGAVFAGTGLLLEPQNNDGWKAVYAVSDMLFSGGLGLLASKKVDSLWESKRQVVADFKSLEEAVKNHRNRPKHL